MAAFPDREARERAAGALLRVIEAGFGADAALLAAVRDWVAFSDGPAPPPPRCCVCARTLAGAVVVPGGFTARLLLAKNAGPNAVCGPCIAAAVEAFAVPTWTDEERKADRAKPPWDMALAQLERALALLSEEDAAVVRTCLAARPQATAAKCSHCTQEKPVVSGRGAGGLCADCARRARSTFGDLACRGELERGDTNCPECGAEEIAAAPVGIEFTELTCLACGHSETCDVWQLMDWHG